MDSEEKKGLEQSYKTRNESLRDFYDTAKHVVDDAEQESLTPILNSLKQSKTQRYREIDQIGEGGEKKITLAHDETLDRKVAVARAIHAKNAQEQEQFLREARLTAKLSHPTIMPVYNMGLDENGEPFFSMEVVPGDSLKTIVRRLRDGDPKYKRDYPRETLLDIFCKVCDAIAYAHSRNVLHLDIKPDNIRVGEFGEVLVCDWGLAKVVNGSPATSVKNPGEFDSDVLNDMTLTGTMKGTPGYMAPEQTQAYGEKTTKTDIYALGALLYTFLTFELHVQGSNASEIVRNTRSGKVIPPRRRKPEWRIPESLSAVTMKALALDPAQRYESVLMLRREITLFLSGRPTEAERANLVKKVSLLLQRHSSIALLLIAYLVLTSALGINYLLKLRNERDVAQQARSEAQENFNLFLREQRVAKARGENLSEAVLYTVKSSDFINAPSMINVLNAGLQEEIDDEMRRDLLTQKGTLHFILQEFDSALDCFEQIGKSERIDAMAVISRKYSRLKNEDNQRLSDHQLADLFKEETDINPLILNYLYYHHMRRRPASGSPQEYLPLASSFLDRLNRINNPGIRPFILEPYEGGFQLDLTYRNYHTLLAEVSGAFRLNVLEPLQLKSLNLSYTRISDLDNLDGLKLDKLTLVKTPVQNKRLLPEKAEALGLKMIALDAEEYDNLIIERLKRSMVVIDKKR